jgi:DNA-binding protein Fis
MTDKDGEVEMKSIANARTLTPVEDRAAEEAVTQSSALIKAALSLSQAIEALSRFNLQGELGLPDVKSGVSFYEQVSRFESALILEAMRAARGRQRAASALLGLKPTTLNSMLKRYGIAGDAYAAAGDVELPRDGRAHGPRQSQRPEPTTCGPVRLPRTHSVAAAAPAGVNEVSVVEPAFKDED